MHRCALASLHQQSGQAAGKAGQAWLVQELGGVGDEMEQSRNGVAGTWWVGGPMGGPTQREGWRQDQDTWNCTSEIPLGNVFSLPQVALQPVSTPDCTWVRHVVGLLVQLRVRTALL